jgi:hypothetical protein
MSLFKKDYHQNQHLKIRLSYLVFLCLLSGCSAMGTVAKSTFYTAQESWNIQPQAVRDSYPLWVKKKFYTAELLLSPLKKWRIKVVSDEDISQDITQGTIKLSYKLKDVNNFVTVPLTLEDTIKATKKAPEFNYIFAMNSAEAQQFWQQYNNHIFNLEKPWFDYFLQPEFKTNSNIARKIKRIEYKFVDSFGFLTLKSFMLHFDFLDDDKWQNFCDNTPYSYNKQATCGVVTINDASKVNP